MIAARPIGATHATLTVQLDAHVKSTGKVDLLARWTDPRDDLESAYEQVAGRWFHPPDAVTIDVVRTSETTNLCTTLLSRLP